MCDLANTSFTQEIECRFCKTEKTCNALKHSFVHRCEWQYIPGRIDYWGVKDGLCTDGLDFPTLAASPWIMMLGWAMLVYVIGLVRRERGQYADLRRYGERVTADVVKQDDVEQHEVETVPTLPNLMVPRYYIQVRWRVDPRLRNFPLQTGCRPLAFRLWLRRHFLSCCLGRPAVIEPWDRTCVAHGDVDNLSMGEMEHHRKMFEKGDADGSGELDLNELRGVMDTLGRRDISSEKLAEVMVMMGSEDGKLLSWDAFNEWYSVLTDQRVGKFAAMKLQCTEAIWHDVANRHMQLRVIYDPLIEGSAMSEVAIIGQPVPLAILYVLGLSFGCSIIMMGMVMVIDAFNCGHHFWGFPECCGHCADWVDGAGKWGQKCFRGACDGLGGKTHLYWCEAQCSVMWALLPIPCSVCGILFALAGLQLRNAGATNDKTKTGRLCRFVCGEGKFCCPAEPSSLYFEEAYRTANGDQLPNERGVVLGYSHVL